MLMSCPPPAVESTNAPPCAPYPMFGALLVPQHSPTHQHMLLLLLAVQGVCGGDEPCLWVDGEGPPRETPIGHLPIGTCMEKHGLSSPAATPEAPHLAAAVNLPSPMLPTQASHRLWEMTSALAGKAGTEKSGGGKSQPSPACGRENRPKNPQGTKATVLGSRGNHSPYSHFQLLSGSSPLLICRPGDDPSLLWSARLSKPGVREQTAPGPRCCISTRAPDRTGQPILALHPHPGPGPWPATAAQGCQLVSSP